MAGDSFTEMTDQSWASRITESIKGVLFGVVLFLVAFPILVWNEGRAVHTAKSLEEGAHAVVSVAADKIDPADQGKLVHMTGEATTTQTLSDPEFGVALTAIKLRRQVEMYQWKEDRQSKTTKKLGGGTKTVTTYTYEKTWSPELINSSSFNKPGGHENPSAMPLPSQTWTASEVTLGAFTLSGAQVDQLSKYQSLDLGSDAAARLAPDMKGKATLTSGGFYLGADASSPAIGDTKVSFQVVRPTTVSIVALQSGNTFEAYQAKAGGSILLLDYGAVSADSMFKGAEQRNEVFTWILRLAGFLLMAVGLFLIFRPFEVLADIVPFLGSLLGAGIGLFAFGVAAALSLVTIAVSWLAFRPLYGVLMLLAAAGAVAGLVHLAGKRRAERKPQMQPRPAAAN